VQLEARERVLSDQAANIEALKAQHEADILNDDSLKQAAEQARAEADAATQAKADLEATLAPLDVKATELAAALTDNPDTPSVSSEFVVAGQEQPSPSGEGSQTDAALETVSID
jgi:hypothetical protein